MTIFDRLSEYGINLPGAAGTLQARRDVKGLVVELGANYDRYHAFLAAEFDRRGPIPTPEAEPDIARNLGAYASLQAIVIAELFLRAAALNVENHRDVLEPLPLGTVCLTPDERLASRSDDDQIRYGPAEPGQGRGPRVSGTFPSPEAERIFRGDPRTSR